MIKVTEVADWRGDGYVATLIEVRVFGVLVYRYTLHG